MSGRRIGRHDACACRVAALLGVHLGRVDVAASPNRRVVCESEGASASGSAAMPLGWLPGRLRVKLLRTRAT
jgi:hypothetical protein